MHKSFFLASCQTKKARVSPNLTHNSHSSSLRMRDNRLFVEAIEYKPMPINSTVEIACPKWSRDRLRLAPPGARYWSTAQPLSLYKTSYLTKTTNLNTHSISTPRAELVPTRLQTRGASNQRVARIFRTPCRRLWATKCLILISASECPASQASCNGPTGTAIPHVANTASQCFFALGLGVWYAISRLRVALSAANQSPAW